jgi:hypothetical protein
MSYLTWSLLGLSPIDFVLHRRYWYIVMTSLVCSSYIDMFANLGYVSSVLPSWALPVYYYALYQHFAIMGYMSHRYCLLGQYRNTTMLLGLY